MAKRAATACTNMAAATKRAKGAAADPVAAKIAQIVAALEDADVPAGALQVLAQALPHSLGVLSEERHRFQVEAVEMLDAELSKIEASLKEGITVARTAKDDATEKAASKATEMTTLQEGLEAKRQEMQRCKSILAGSAQRFQETKAERQEKLAQRESALAGITKAEASKAQIEALAQEVDTVHANENSSGACTKLLAQLSKHVPMDETMKTAIPAALTQSPETRGGFDAMVVQSVHSTIAKHIEGLSAKIAGAEPMKAALETDVAAAESAHQAAKETQKESASLFIAAQSATSGHQEEVKALQKELATSKRLCKKTADGLDDAEEKLHLFTTGPLEAFTFLREHTAPQAVDPEETTAELPVTAFEVSSGTAVGAC